MISCVVKSYIIYISIIYFCFLSECHVTAPPTLTGRSPGARRDLKSPGGEVGAVVEIGAETGGGREIGDIGVTPQRAATPVRLIINVILIIKTSLLSLQTPAMTEAKGEETERKKDFQRLRGWPR